MSAWTDLVKQIYNENKSKPNYKLGDAMKAAKKIYKKPKTAKNVKPTKGTRKNKK